MITDSLQTNDTTTISNDCKQSDDLTLSSEPTACTQATIITRGEAQAKLLKTYFTGKPCKHGHISERYTSTGACLACMDFHVANYQARQKKVSKAISRAARKATLTGKRNVPLYVPALTTPKVIQL
jgi:hypothetical protein